MCIVGVCVTTGVPDQHTTNTLLGPVCRHRHSSLYILVHASPFECVMNSSHPLFPTVGFYGKCFSSRVCIVYDAPSKFGQLIINDFCPSVMSGSECDSDSCTVKATDGCTICKDKYIVTED